MEAAAIANGHPSDDVEAISVFAADDSLSVELWKPETRVHEITHFPFDPSEAVMLLSSTALLESGSWEEDLATMLDISTLELGINFGLLYNSPMALYASEVEGSDAAHCEKVMTDTFEGIRRELGTLRTRAVVFVLNCSELIDNWQSLLKLEEFGTKVYFAVSSFSSKNMYGCALDHFISLSTAPADMEVTCEIDSLFLKELPQNKVVLLDKDTVHSCVCSLWTKHGKNLH